MSSWLGLEMEWAVFKLRFSCWLWNVRGLEICKEHGFHAQSWINGECSACNAEEAKR